MRSGSWKNLLAVSGPTGRPGLLQVAASPVARPPHLRRDGAPSPSRVSSPTSPPAIRWGQRSASKGHVVRPGHPSSLRSAGACPTSRSRRGRPGIATGPRVWRVRSARHQHMDTWGVPRCHGSTSSRFLLFPAPTPCEAASNTAVAHPDSAPRASSGPGSPEPCSLRLRPFIQTNLVTWCLCSEAPH